MNFVWLYEGKHTEELEMSIALVRKRYSDAHITVITTSAKVYNFADHWHEPKTVLTNKHADQLFKLKTFIDELPAEFYVMNDDFFIIDEIQDDGDIRGQLSTLLEQRKVKDAYYVAMQNTIGMLDELGFPLWNFELHKPFLVDRETLIQALRLLRSDREAILWRSLYGNTRALGLTPQHVDAADVKNIPFGASWCLSTDGYSYPRYRSKLKEVLSE